MSDDAAIKRANYVQGLKVEREMYAAAGRTDRVKQVDAELARFQEAPPKQRTSRRKETT